MRHRRRGRHLGRSSSHRKAMLRNLASSLFLTERDDDYYEGLVEADGKTVVNPPQRKGRVVTTLQKAKEARTLVERCITIAKNSLEHEERAEEFGTDAERNSDEWKSWRESDSYSKWNQAIAPAVAARRRVFALLRDKEAVSLLFDEIAPRYTDRPGGYTRVVRLAQPRLGDAGVQAILELVGQNDRIVVESQKPAFDDTDEDVTEEAAEDESVENEAVEPDEAAEEGAGDAVAEDSDDASEEESKS